MEVRIEIDGETALRLRPNVRAWPEGEAIEAGPAIHELSCGLDAATPRSRMVAWLEHLVPENGHRERFKAIAAKRMARVGAPGHVANVGHELWGNSDREFTGKVDVVATDAEGNLVEWSEEEGYEAVSNDLVGVLLAAAGRQAEQGRMPPEAEVSLRDHGLSGMRGKVCLRWSERGRTWLAPKGKALSTHILKNESDREWLPAEAGIESFCQRALALAGIDANDTRARVYNGIETVVSRRSDRMEQGEGKPVERIHQEEWSQAIGLFPYEKYIDDRPDTEWPSLFRLLQRHGQDPEREQYKLAKAIAGIVLSGNADVHRRNIGLQHVRGREGRQCVLAPLYDCSSIEGTQWTGTKRMQIPVGGAIEFDEVTDEHWRRLANAAGADAGMVMDAVRESAEKLPDAMAQAAERVRIGDEVRQPKTRDTRIETIREHTERRCREILRRLGPRPEKRQSRTQTAGADRRRHRG